MMKQGNTSILVLCTGNSCRSQMSEGWLRHFGGGHVEVYSAGTEPSEVHPLAVKVMKEAGVDISRHKSSHISAYEDKDFHYVITVCDHAREVCPVFPETTKNIHHSFKDPAGFTGSESEILEGFREVRDQIRNFCRNFIKKEINTEQSASKNKGT